jgi:hypothetical protein
MSKPTFNESVEELNNAVNELLRVLGLYRLLDRLEALLARLGMKP